MNKDVFLIVMAMRGEAQPLIEKLCLEEKHAIFSPTPILVFEGNFKEKSVVLLLNGVHESTQKDLIGTQNATLTTILGVQKYRPTKILNFGTCGALNSRGSKIGDLYLAVDRVWFHTRRVPLPGWDQIGFGGYTTAGNNLLAKKLGLKPGILSSTDSLDFPEMDAKVFSQLNADIADMEGAAIAWLAEMHRIAFYAVKGVTDLMDFERKTGEQFEENFAKLVPWICDAAFALLNELT